MTREELERWQQGLYHKKQGNKGEVAWYSIATPASSTVCSLELAGEPTLVLDEIQDKKDKDDDDSGKSKSKSEDEVEDIDEGKSEDEVEDIDEGIGQGKVYMTKEQLR